MDDIHDTEHNSRKVTTPESVLTDRGQKVGGDKYTDRLLGISNKEGKQLSKLILKAEGDNKPIAQKVTKLPFNFVYMKTRFLAYNPKSK